VVAAIQGSTKPHGTKAPVATAQAEYPRVAVDRKLEVPELVALLMRAEKILAAVLDPFHRTADEARACGNAGVFRIDRALRAEAAADVGRDDVHLVVVELEEIE
jgi:hypothetical protein